MYTVLVYEMMNNWTPEKMLQFIEEYTLSYQENSNLQNQEASKETLKNLEILELKQSTKYINIILINF